MIKVLICKEELIKVYNIAHSL